MEKIISTILSKHCDLFGENSTAERINVGFTNCIYSVDDSFIVKICTKESKEIGFAKEIDLYNANQANLLIPKLYFSDISKTDIPYYYEILEKLDGVSLYNVWHTFSENQREDIIRQLCQAIEHFHCAKSNSYDWISYNKELFLPLFEKAKQNNLFNSQEYAMLEKAYSLFDKYLVYDEFVTVHNDLHFDNIIYKDGKIKLIDFERSISAPRDFELDILYRMVRKPWKFASEESEAYTHPDQYKNIMLYTERYYPQLFQVPYLYQRLAIYDMIYFLKQYVNAPEYDDLKQDVLTAANLIIK